MNRRPFFSAIVASVLLLFTHLSMAIEATGNNETSIAVENKVQHSAIQHLQLMQQAYKEKNYEILYLNNLQNQLEPMQLIHGKVDDEEVSYFRYLNGAIRESLQYKGKISYFEQGAPAYTLESRHNRTVFAHIAEYDLEKGKVNYEYVILGKGRIAGKQSIAVRMISKDEYRNSYVIWCDLESNLPLRLDTLSQSNVVLEQIMVVSLNTTEQANPWLEQVVQQTLPEIVHIPQSTTNNTSHWKANWLPKGFVVVKDDQHKLLMHENEAVSYIMLDDGIVNVSIYISNKKIALDEKQKIIRRGATILLSEQRAGIEFNVVGNIPVLTAKRLIESIELVKNDH